ncbi:MAG: hypothetical protein UT94_C0018G0006 [Candidatus Uhrbacteria bacterium GW2011_GWF2_40_263]|nr:MAG: hypothetical protein UT94_C0018G0006 [Candidatus Uhrbacteria bacterium GW2011_GWF2_40_263]
MKIESKFVMKTKNNYHIPRLDDNFARDDRGVYNLARDDRG